MSHPDDEFHPPTTPDPEWMSGPLVDLRVVDLTDLRGALCGRILADLGAEVVKIENPGAAPGAVTSTAHRYRNANKAGVVVDLADPGGRERLEALLTEADVLVENLGPAGHAATGFSPEHTTGRHGHLVHVSMSDFGLSGPRRDWRLEPLPALAASGTLYASGFPDLPPCWMPGHVAADCASVYGAIGTLAAVMDRDRHGAGQVIEISVQEAGLAGTTVWSLALADYLRVNPFLPAKGTRNADGAYWVLPAADGWVRTVIGNEKQWDGFFSLLGQPEVLAAPEWKQQIHRLMNADVIRLVAQELLTDRSRAELFEEARAAGATAGVLHTPSEFVSHPQTRARRYFTGTGFPGLGDAPFATFPPRLSATAASLRRAAPEPGEDAGVIPFGSARGNRAGGGPSGAQQSDAGGLLLEGVRVVEFGMAAVVPELCGVLSELGADVVKVESEAHLDVLRQTGFGRINCGFAFNAECRGRRSVALDLSTQEGRRLAFDLCAGADLVAENYRGGVLDQMGLGYDDVRAANPSVIYVSSQGYGRGGPLGEMAAYGPLNFGFAGLHHLWNHPDAPYPCGTSLNHPDHIAGKLLAVAVLAALRHRSATGEGQRVEMAQTEAAAYMHGEVYLDASLSGRDPTAAGNHSERACPHGVYLCGGEDSWVAIAVPDDRTWERFRTAVGWPAEPELSGLAGRLARRDELDRRTAEWTSARKAEEAAALLQAHGVSAMPVMGPEDHHADEHLAERGFIVTLEHAEVGTERHVGNPIRLSRTPQRTAASAHPLGADTEEVLTTILGLTPARVAELVTGGVCR